MEMGRTVSPDHTPIPVHYWGGRVRCKRFFSRYRAPDGGYSHVQRKSALLHLPANSLVLGGYVSFNTVVAGFDGAVIRIFPEGNDNNDNLVWEVGQPSGEGQAEEPKRITASRTYFPGTLEWWKGTYDAHATTGKRYWMFGAMSAPFISGSTTDYSFAVTNFVTPTVWYASITDTVSMSADENYNVDGYILYMND